MAAPKTRSRHALINNRLEEGGGRGTHLHARAWGLREIHRHTHPREPGQSPRPGSLVDYPKNGHPKAASTYNKMSSCQYSVGNLDVASIPEIRRRAAEENTIYFGDTSSTRRIRRGAVESTCAHGSSK